jgi:hypothetical protein
MDLLSGIEDAIFAASLLPQPAQSLSRYVFTFPGLEVVPRNAYFGSDDQ